MPLNTIWDILLESQLIEADERGQVLTKEHKRKLEIATKILNEKADPASIADKDAAATRIKEMVSSYDLTEKFILANSSLASDPTIKDVIKNITTGQEPTTQDFTVGGNIKFPADGEGMKGTGRVGYSKTYPDGSGFKVKADASATSPSSQKWLPTFDINTEVSYTKKSYDPKTVFDQIQEHQSDLDKQVARGNQTLEDGVKKMKADLAKKPAPQPFKLDLTTYPGKQSTVGEGKVLPGDSPQQLKKSEGTLSPEKKETLRKVVDTAKKGLKK